MKPIIGTMRWGQAGAKLSILEQAKLIEKSLEYGFNTFDSADIYGNYTAEKDFGFALKESGIERSKVEIISKCGICLPSENSPYKTKYYDTSASHIISSVDESLENFQTDYLDYLLIHRPSPLMNLEEIANTIVNLKDEGKILNFGVSNFTPLEYAYLNEIIGLDTNQIEFSLLHPDPLFDGTILQAQTLNIPIMAWSPLGHFFGLQTLQELKISVAVFAQKYECSESLILLSWICNNPAQIIPVVGSTQVERIKELQQLPDIQLETEEWFLLLEKSRGYKVP